MNKIYRDSFHSRVDIWARHPRRIKVKIHAYKTLHQIFKHINEELSNYFKTKHLINKSKGETLGLKGRFREDYVGAAFNLPNPSILLSRKVENLAFGWFDKISKKLNINTRLHNPYSIPLKLQTEGLCAGISLDVAKRHLIDTEPLTAIISSLELGASLEALATQSVYIYLNRLSLCRMNKTLRNLLDEIAEFQKFPEVPEAFRFNIELLKTVLSNLANIDEHDKLLKIRDRINLESDPEKQKVLIFAAHLIQIEQELRLGKSVNRKEGHYELEDGDLHGIFAINQFLLSLLHENSFVSELTLRLLSEERGVHFVHLRDKLGSALLLKTDREYLQNLDRLEDGCYMIQFHFSGGCHILTLIRENGKDTIIDPNFGSIQSQNSARTKWHLEHLIELYPLSCSSDSEFANHSIEILKYEKS